VVTPYPEAKKPRLMKGFAVFTPVQITLMEIIKKKKKAVFK